MDAAAAARQAVRDDDVDALRAAIAAGADPNASIHSHQQIIPLLALAAGKGHLGICELLVASGAARLVRQYVATSYPQVD